MLTKAKYKLYRRYISKDNINWIPTDEYKASVIEGMECTEECGASPASILATKYDVYPKMINVQVQWDATSTTINYSGITVNMLTDYSINSSVTETFETKLFITEKNYSRTESKFSEFQYTYEDAIGIVKIEQLPNQTPITDCDTIITLTNGEQEVYTNLELTPYQFGSGRTDIASIKFGTCFTGYVDNQSFASCPNLTTVEFTSPYRLEIGIGDNAFASCPSLTSVTFESIQPPCSVGTNVFYMFSAKPEESFSIYVPTISIDAYKKVFKEWYSNNYIKPNPNWKPSENAQTVFTFENGTTSALTTTAITRNSVLSYINATDIYIGDACTRVSTYAFQNYNKLKTVTVGSNSVLTKFDDNCFDSLHLESMYMYKPTPPTMTDYCYYNFEVDNVYVPSQYVDTYKHTAYWGNLNIIPI